MPVAPCERPGAPDSQPRRGVVIRIHRTIPRTSRRHTRTALTALTFAIALLACSPAAHAADLLVLDGDQATVSGNLSYGIVYVDGELRLTGDTSITASTIYIGPSAGLRTCYVEGTGNGGCTAGRNLTLTSAGQLTVASGIDLTAGTGTARPGGSLNLQGSRVAVGGSINTTGSGGASSGSITINSAGALNTGALTAYGATVNLAAAGPIDIGGDIQTQGTSGVPQNVPLQAQFAGPVAVASSGGDVRISGNVNASGRDAPGNAGAGLGGGNGADVSISGSDVRLGSVDATGGSSVDAAPGGSAHIALAARGSLIALGRLDAGGQNSTVGAATPGAHIDATAGGPLVIGGGAWAGGAQSPSGGSAGGAIALQGQTISAGTLFVAGGNAASSPTPMNGGPGGSITASASGNVSLAALQAYGGNGQPGSSPGAGGSIAVASGAGSIGTGQVTTQGGYTGGGPGAPGGPISLSAQTDLSVGGTLDASGSNANGDADPPRPGADAGNVLLRAATGTLSLGGQMRAAGGSGAGSTVATAAGGRGGNGGRLDLVAKALGSIVSISTHGGNGGDYGDLQGPGGTGGAVLGWTDAPLFDDQKVVDSDGGSGHPVGSSGVRTQESSPTALAVDPATGRLTFTTRSPDAQLYRVLRSVGGAPAEVALESAQTTGLAPASPVCVPVTFTVVAVHKDLGWTSDAPAPVSFTRPPSATQGCGDAPKLSAAARLRFSLRSLRRKKYRAVLKLRADGIGSVQANLLPVRRKGHKTATKPLAKLGLQVAKVGGQTVQLVLPKAARRPGRYTLQLAATSPDGKGHVTTTLTLEVRK